MHQRRRTFQSCTSIFLTMLPIKVKGIQMEIMQGTPSAARLPLEVQQDQPLSHCTAVPPRCKPHTSIAAHFHKPLPSSRLGIQRNPQQQTIATDEQRSKQRRTEDCSNAVQGQLASLTCQPNGAKEEEEAYPEQEGGGREGLRQDDAGRGMLHRQPTSHHATTRFTSRPKPNAQRTSHADNRNDVGMPLKAAASQTGRMPSSPVPVREKIYQPPPKPAIVSGKRNQGMAFLTGTHHYIRQCFNTSLASYPSCWQ